MSKLGGRLFWVGDDIEKHVGVALDAKIKAPVVVHPSLPHISGFVVLLGTEGRMAEILQKKDELLVKKRSYPDGSVGVAPFKDGREADFHLFVSSFFACR